MKRKVIVLLDAFRWDYISQSHTPFYINLKNKIFILRNWLLAQVFAKDLKFSLG